MYYRVRGRRGGREGGKSERDRASTPFGVDRVLPLRINHHRATYNTLSIHKQYNTIPLSQQHTRNTTSYAPLTRASPHNKILLHTNTTHHTMCIINTTTQLHHHHLYNYAITSFTSNVIIFYPHHHHFLSPSPYLSLPLSTSSSPLSYVFSVSFSKCTINRYIVFAPLWIALLYFSILLALWTNDTMTRKYHSLGGSTWILSGVVAFTCWTVLLSYKLQTPHSNIAWQFVFIPFWFCLAVLLLVDGTFPSETRTYGFHTPFTHPENVSKMT